MSQPTLPPPSEPFDTIHYIDPNGDVVIGFFDLNNEPLDSYLVSSKVLSLASPVFANLFQPYFAEGKKLLAHYLPTIEMRGDNDFSMETILTILHHHGSIMDRMTAEELADLAIHSDKYRCVKALGPWIPHWFGKTQHTANTSKELGYLVIAAYMFSDKGEFASISQKAILQLPPNFSSQWDLIAMLEHLPLNLAGDISKRIYKTLNRMQKELESGETLLRQNQRCYIMQNLFCVDCGRTLPIEAKKCHPCRNTTLEQKYCTMKSRVADYFDILRMCGLWPSTGPFHNSSISEILLQFELIGRTLKHSCEMALRCPLRVAMEDLTIKVQQIKNDVRGLCFECIRNETLDENEACPHQQCKI